MRVFVFLVGLIFAPGAVAAVAVGMYFNPSNASTGVLTIARLTAATEAASSPGENAPYWVAQTIDPPNFVRMYIADDKGDVPAFPFTVTINSTTTTGGGTKWMRYDHADLAYVEAAAWRFPGYPAPASNPIVDVLKFGYVKFSAVNSGVQINFDHISLYSPFSILQQQITPTTNILTAHSQVGGQSTSGPPVSITISKLYLYQLYKQSSSGLVHVRLHDPDQNFALVGTSTINSDVGIQTYVDFWGVQSNGICVGETLWGNACIIYNATGFLFNDPTGGLSGSAGLAGQASIK